MCFRTTPILAGKPFLFDGQAKSIDIYPHIRLEWILIISNTRVKQRSPLVLARARFTWYYITFISKMECFKLTITLDTTNSRHGGIFGGPGKKGSFNGPHTLAFFVCICETTDFMGMPTLG